MEEQELFAKLSIFDGGATAGAIEFVCCEEESAAAAVILILRNLALKSLILAEDTAWGEKRFRLLEPIREFAEAKRSPDQEHQLRSRHFDWHHHLAVQAAGVGLDADDGHYMKWLSAEYNNVRAALAWAKDDSEKRIVVLETCIALYPFWTRRSLLREGAGWFQTAIDAAPDAPAEMHADALNKLGGIMYFLGKAQAAEKSFRASLELWRELGNTLKVAAGINNLAIIASQGERHAEARLLYLEAIPLFEVAGDLMRLANCLQNMAVGEEILGDLDSALRYFERAHPLYPEGVEETDLCNLVLNLLGVHAQKVQLVQVAELVKKGLGLAIRVGEQASSRGMLEIGSGYALEIGKPQMAAKFLGAALKAGDRAEAIDDARTARFRRILEPRILEALGSAEFKRLVKLGRSLSTREALQEALEMISHDAPD
jgi:tetratricopeptide (TPR) repeat protein